MNTALIALTALVGWIFAAYLLVGTTLATKGMRRDHAGELASRDARIEQLIDQVQLNAQNLTYYPQVGPFEAPPESKYLSSPDGLLVFEDYEDDAIAEVAGA